MHRHDRIVLGVAINSAAIFALAVLLMRSPVKGSNLGCLWQPILLTFLIPLPLFWWGLLKTWPLSWIWGSVTVLIFVILLGRLDPRLQGKWLFEIAGAIAFGAWYARIGRRSRDID